ncbi:uncharacterized protein LOC141852370 [Brevipalpus obovatus]|uniref:uncharacterized protein LOC141852370 n=1 Tax=Brevipalpus obovatus TaxID=246614 RepID=UPI003D9DE78A
MESSKYRPRVSSKHFQENIGKDVVVLVRVSRPDSSGRSIRAQTTDGSYIMLLMDQPLSEPLEDGTIIEVEGKVSSKSTIGVTNFFHVPNEVPADINFELYTEMSNMLASELVRNNFIIDDVSEHHGTGTDPELIANPNENNDEMGGFDHERSLFES